VFVSSLLIYISNRGQVNTLTPTSIFLNKPYAKLEEVCKKQVGFGVFCCTPMSLIVSRNTRIKKLNTKTPLSVKFAKQHHDQTDSPLFGLIPAEMRNEIFLLALSSYDDKSRPYPYDAYHSRPGYRYSQRIDTNLLATCRRIYLETYLVPVAVNEHVFWCYRGPTNSEDDPKAYFGRLTEEQKDAVTNVHFFTEMFWLEGSFPNLCAVKWMRPRSIKLTIRHSNWWFWGNNAKLRLEEGWGRMLKKLMGLEELELKLEIIERDKDQVLPKPRFVIVVTCVNGLQMDAIAARMAELQFDLHDGRILSTAGTNIRSHRWVGPSIFEGSRRYLAERNHWETILPIEGLPSEAQQTQDPGLVYCVVTLKWQAIAA